MDLDDIALFRSIATSGTLAAAGRQLGLPAMAVSRRLVGLEKQVGVRLFHRTTRSLSLTAEGEAFLPHANALLQAQDAAMLAISQDEQALRGVLRVTAPNVIGRSIVVPAMTTLMARNPQLKVELGLTDGIVDIAGSGLDLAVRVSPLESSELIGTRLASNPRILCAAPAYLERAGQPKTLSELEDHNCLTLSGLSSWSFDVGVETQWVKVTGSFSSSSVEAVRAACLGGAGIAQMTYWDVWDYLDSGQLKRVELEDASLPNLGIWAVYPTKQHMPRKTSAVIDAIKNQLLEFSRTAP